MLKPSNGSSQLAVARINDAIISTARMAAVSQATMRHRGDTRCPVGNNRKSSTRQAIGIGHTALLSHARGWPPGTVPGWAISACNA
jgi:hypothetical protein